MDASISTSVSKSINGKRQVFWVCTQASHVLIFKGKEMVSFKII